MSGVFSGAVKRLAAAFAQSGGAANVGATQPEAGAVATNVLAFFQRFKFRQDYDSDAHFLAAAGNNPSVDAAGNFDAKVKPAGEAAQVALSAAVSPVIAQGRSRINYYSDTSVQVYVPPNVVMGGFRVNGSYKKGRAPLVSTGVDGSAIVSTPGQLGAETAVRADNWYAVFACANPGDAAVTFKIMPFLRVGSVAGQVATLNHAGIGPNAHAIAAAAYTFTANGLAGVDCLVITEILAGKNRFAGRTTKITANTTTAVTLQTVGTVGAYDFLLPAPPGFQNYAYLGAFYIDSASHVMNIADSGQTVYSLSTYLQDPSFIAAGAIASPGVQIHCGGYVSPLATAIIVQDNESLSTASTGQLYTNFAHDSSGHLIGQAVIIKEAATSPYSNVGYLTLPFSIDQSFYYYTAGNLQASRSGGQLVVAGYIEP